MSSGWTADDVPGWERRTLPLGTDDDGPVATLVRVATASTAPDRRPAVLHVHGYNDYVFQAHVAAALAERGYAFYGVDLRRCGRSRRPGEVAHFTTDMAEYRADLDAATGTVRDAGHPWVAVAGHSTGGLAALLWAAVRPAGSRPTGARDGGAVPPGPDALVLNSPWLSLNGQWWRRTTQAAVAAVVGRMAPLRPVERGGGSAYQRQLHVANGGRWEYDLARKPPGGFPVRAGWLRAATRAQRAVARGLAVEVPVLVCTSASYGPNRDDNPELRRQETVLDLARTWRLAPRLGPDVTAVRIAGGVHDLSLSADGPRAEYLRTVLDWLDAHVSRVPERPAAARGERPEDDVP